MYIEKTKFIMLDHSKVLLISNMTNISKTTNTKQYEQCWTITNNKINGFGCKFRCCLITIFK